jgi:hypothetical protein
VGKKKRSYIWIRSYDLERARRMSGEAEGGDLQMILKWLGGTFKLKRCGLLKIYSLCHDSGARSWNEIFGNLDI